MSHSDHDKEDGPDQGWLDAFNELDHIIQHGLNLLTIAIIAARETLFGDDKEDGK